jgi:hypothetical protein
MYNWVLITTDYEIITSGISNTFNGVIDDLLNHQIIFVNLKRDFLEKKIRKSDSFKQTIPFKNYRILLHKTPNWSIILNNFNTDWVDVDFQMYWANFQLFENFITFEWEEQLKIILEKPFEDLPEWEQILIELWNWYKLLPSNKALIDINKDELYLVQLNKLISIREYLWS